jgi:hypothetical protein
LRKLLVRERWGERDRERGREGERSEEKGNIKM